MADMEIIKIEVSVSALTRLLDQFRKDRLKAFELITNDLKQSVGHFMSQLLNLEMSLFLGKPEQAGNKRNGYYEKEYAFKGIGCLRIRMPLDRRCSFKSEVLLPSEQIDPRIKADLALIHLAGISTRLISMISKKLFGVEVSPDTVTSSLGLVEEKALGWLNRPLIEKYWALFVDGTNFRIQRKGSTKKEPSLVVLGINEKNHLSILAIEPGQKDNAECWSVLFDDLKKRGLDSASIRLGIMDGLPGLEKVFQESFSEAVVARCWVHAMRNVMAKTPARFAKSFKELVHNVMYAASEDHARVAFKHLKSEMIGSCERAVMCLEKDLESLLVHYRFDSKLWRTLKTTNPIERVNRELKRRTKTMETIGERTLRIVTAFIALRLEYHWQRVAVSDYAMNKLQPVQLNQIESAMVAMIH